MSVLRNFLGVTLLGISNVVLRTVAHPDRPHQAITIPWESFIVGRKKTKREMKTKVRKGVPFIWALV